MRGARLDLNTFEALMHLGRVLKLLNDPEVLEAPSECGLLRPQDGLTTFKLSNMLCRVIIVMLPSARVSRYQSGCAAES